MDKKFFKKITCQSPDDLTYISALVSEGKIKSTDLKYLPKNKIFLFLIERLNKERKESKKKIKSIIKFAYIISMKLKNFKFSNKEEIFELLAIDILKKDQNYEIVLLFSNNRFITLNAEVIDIELTDQMIANDESNKL
tara:strand:+ start:159 stop:572 length:414 start_codon:yes stop_codon:yes gene_type:complete